MCMALVSGERIAELAKALGSLDYPAIIAAVDIYAEEGATYFVFCRISKCMFVKRC